MVERYAFGFLILFLFSAKLIKALIKVSDTKSSACSKLFVFFKARENKYSEYSNKCFYFIIQFHTIISYTI